MKTNIKKFLKNYKLLKADNSEYVIYGKRLLVDDLKVCICIEPFIHDDLPIEKGNVYLIRERATGSCSIYELTGLWRNRGHDANILTFTALNNGLKGWNIPGGRKDYFKIINIKHLNSFLYWRN